MNPKEKTYNGPVENFIPQMYIEGGGTGKSVPMVEVALTWTIPLI